MKYNAKQASNFFQEQLYSTNFFPFGPYNICNGYTGYNIFCSGIYLGHPFQIS